MEVFAGKSMPAYDLMKEAKELDETKAGVKGLADSGIVKIPKFFIHAPENLPKASDISKNQLDVPVIDLKGVNGNRRVEIVDEIRRASETWGLFLIVNHGLPINILDGAIEGMRRFHEQPSEVKMEYYSHDAKRKFRFYTNNGFNIFHGSSAWNLKDTIGFDSRVDQGGLDSDELPSFFKTTVEYSKYMVALKETLSELLSEALGLNRDHLKHIEFMETHVMAGHYYPIFPEPNLTLGIAKHTDPFSLTILLQDHIGGLQILHENRWVDVPPLEGALIVNVGDFLQLITNDKFVSAAHRVLAQCKESRMSIACFLHPSVNKMFEPYGPLEELTSNNNPPKYRQTAFHEMYTYFQAKGYDENSTLSHFKLAPENCSNSIK